MESFNNVKQLYNISQEIMPKLKVRKHISKEFIGVLLYLSIVENIYTCIFLMENQLNSAIAIILRSVLEAYIDLFNLSEDEDYLEVLKFTSDISIKLLKATIKDNSNRDSIGELFSQYDNCENLESVLNKMLEEQKNSYELAVKHYNLAEKKYQNISIYQKFKIAKKEQWYEKQYAMLCTSSHNNLNTLVQRNVQVEEPGNYSIQMFVPIDQSDFDYYCDIISTVLTDAIRSIFKILNIENDDLIRVIELREKFLQIYEH